MVLFSNSFLFVIYAVSDDEESTKNLLILISKNLRAFDEGHGKRRSGMGTQIFLFLQFRSISTGTRLIHLTRM